MKALYISIIYLYLYFFFQHKTNQAMFWFLHIIFMHLLFYSHFPCFLCTSGTGGLTCEEKQTILDEHNRLRQLVALGQIRGQPGAANMMEMVSEEKYLRIQ